MTRNLENLEKGNFLKNLEKSGKKLKKHRSQGKVSECFCIICVFQWMHKIASSGQNFRGQCFAYLLNLLSTLLIKSGNSQGIVREKSAKSQGILF